jgi:hypothetical protein
MIMDNNVILPKLLNKKRQPIHVYKNFRHLFKNTPINS